MGLEIESNCLKRKDRKEPTEKWYLLMFSNKYVGWVCVIELKMVTINLRIWTIWKMLKGSGAWWKGLPAVDREKGNCCRRLSTILPFSTGWHRPSCSILLVGIDNCLFQLVDDDGTFHGQSRLSCSFLSGWQSKLSTSILQPFSSCPKVQLLETKVIWN